MIVSHFWRIIIYVKNQKVSDLSPKGRMNQSYDGNWCCLPLWYLIFRLVCTQGQQPLDKRGGISWQEVAHLIKSPTLLGFTAAE
jgi:hypothetical protein